MRCSLRQLSERPCTPYCYLCEKGAWCPNFAGQTQLEQQPWRRAQQHACAAAGTCLCGCMTRAATWCWPAASSSHTTPGGWSSLEHKSTARFTATSLLTVSHLLLCAAAAAAAAAAAKPTYMRQAIRTGSWRWPAAIFNGCLAAADPCCCTVKLPCATVHTQVHHSPADGNEHSGRALLQAWT